MGWGKRKHSREDDSRTQVIWCKDLNSQGIFTEDGEGRQ